MHITILGGNGFLGRKIAARLAVDGALGGRAVSSGSSARAVPTDNSTPNSPGPILPRSMYTSAAS